MQKRIGLIHATLNSVQPMIEAFQRYEPSVSVLNFMDEGLLLAVNEQESITPQVLRRFLKLIEKAEEAKVDGILLTCSVFSPYVPLIRNFFSVPLVSVDGEMLEQAVEIGHRIGVIATVATAGPTTAVQIEEIAKRKGKKVHVDIAINSEAFAALQVDPLFHDQLIRDIAIKMSEKTDVIVLAQISMARSAVNLENMNVPVLTSPRSSIKAMMAALG